VSDAREHPAVQRYARHVNPAFVKLLGVFGYGRLFERAKGTRIFDHEGKEYLDLLAGFGSVNLGHNHPKLRARLETFLAEDALNFVHVGPSRYEADLAAALAARLPDPLEVTLTSSSGAEAVEAGLKLARAATGRTGFVYCAGGFHGTNLGTLSVMGDARMRKPFEPLLAGTREVPFGDLGALRQALSQRPAAFLLEPIQAEGGVVLPSEGYLAEAQALCTKAGTLLILDEVQTGLGRTGTRFCFEQEGLVPDVLVLAKGLSGGLAPLGATITSAALHERAYGSMDRFDLHSSTFGGNALSAVVGIETLEILDREGLVDNARVQGEALLRGLRERLDGHPLVREVRGRGLLIGIELGPTDRGVLNRVVPGLVRLTAKEAMGQWAALKLLERGVICQPASHAWNVLKIEPPLTITSAEVEEATDAVVGVLSEYEGIGPLLKDVTGRLGRQLFNGGRF